MHEASGAVSLKRHRSWCKEDICLSEQTLAIGYREDGATVTAVGQRKRSALLRWGVYTSAARHALLGCRLHHQRMASSGTAGRCIDSRCGSTQSRRRSSRPPCCGAQETPFHRRSRGKRFEQPLSFPVPSAPQTDDRITCDDDVFLQSYLCPCASLLQKIDWRRTVVSSSFAGIFVGEDIGNHTD